MKSPVSLVSPFNLVEDNCPDDVPALAVRGLSAGYSDNPYTIDHVSFNVARGQRVAVIGPNGAGKSTLFKAIVGLIPHTTGEISFHGRDCRSSHDRVGYVPQHQEVDWSFPVTAADVVMMGRARHLGWFRLPNRHDWQLVNELLDRVGMADFAKRRIGALSGGQKQRVFIARALAQETDVLLLDEPLNGIDPAAEQEVLNTLDTLRDQNIAVLFATHDMELATSRFERLLLLRHRLIAYGEPRDVFHPEYLKAAYGSRVTVFQDANGAVTVLADEHGCQEAH